MNTPTVTVTHAQKHYTSTSEVFFDGQVYRWVSSKRVPPADAIVNYGIDKLPMFHARTHEIVRQEETFSAIEAYRERMRDWTPSGEELHEMRAAYGNGAEVVNVITGQKYRI